jgi:hypothetical protein
MSTTVQGCRVPLAETVLRTAPASTRTTWYCVPSSADDRARVTARNPPVTVATTAAATAARRRTDTSRANDAGAFPVMGVVVMFGLLFRSILHATERL